MSRNLLLAVVTLLAFACGEVGSESSQREDPAEERGPGVRKSADKESLLAIRREQLREDLANARQLPPIKISSCEELRDDWPGYVVECEDMMQQATYGPIFNGTRYEEMCVERRRVRTSWILSKCRVNHTVRTLAHDIGRTPYKRPDMAGYWRCREEERDYWGKQRAADYWCDLLAVMRSDWDTLKLTEEQSRVIYLNNDLREIGLRFLTVEGLTEARQELLEALGVYAEVLEGQGRQMAIRPLHCVAEEAAAGQLEDRVVRRVGQIMGAMAARADEFEAHERGIERVYKAVTTEKERTALKTICGLARHRLHPTRPEGLEGVGA